MNTLYEGNVHYGFYIRGGEDYKSGRECEVAMNTFEWVSYLKGQLDAIKSEGRNPLDWRNK